MWCGCMRACIVCVCVCVCVCVVSCVVACAVCIQASLSHNLLHSVNIWAVRITAIELAEIQPPMFDLHSMR